MSDNEIDLFLQEMQDVTPIKAEPLAATRADYKFNPSLAQQARKEAAQKEISDQQNTLSMEYVPPVDPYDIISYKKSGVQEGVFKKLRLGKYPREAELNLQHLSVMQARMEVFNFLNDCYKRDVRNLIITHGIGKDSKPYPAILKSHVAKWLSEVETVIAYHTAIKSHGGYAATYVLLQKSTKKKAENRERHLKRHN